MQFFRHLVRTSMVSPKQAVRALRAQVGASPPLGQVALMRAEMSVRQIMQVLSAQADRPELRFGELAVELGHLSPGQVQELLRIQREMRPSLDQVLVQQGVLQAAQLWQLKDSYMRAA